MIINPLTELPFYIGKGKDNRAYSHLLKHDTHNHYKADTIEKIRKHGQDPIVCILRKNLSDNDAKEFETKLIDYYGIFDNGGILTNIADGGQGGYTGPVSKKTSEKLSWANAGERNSNCKLTAEQVKEIYYRSDKTISELSREYNIGGNEIRKIKHRKSWSPVTLFLVGRPGFHFKNRFEFFNKDELKQEITELFLDARAPSALTADYCMSFIKIKKIKNRELYTDITKDLTLPDPVIRGLTISDRNKIKKSKLGLDELASKYNVHRETIRNIKNN